MWDRHIIPTEFLIGLSVLELGRGTRQTDGQTGTGRHFIMPLPRRSGHKSTSCNTNSNPNRYRRSSMRDIGPSGK